MEPAARRETPDDTGMAEVFDFPGGRAVPGTSQPVDMKDLNAAIAWARLAMIDREIAYMYRTPEEGPYDPSGS